MFATAQEAAEYLAIVKRDFGPGGVEPPAKQIQQRKPRKRQLSAQHADEESPSSAAAEPMQMPPVVAMAIPMMHAPLVAATPLPAPPLMPLM